MKMIFYRNWGPYLLAFISYLKSVVQGQNAIHLTPSQEYCLPGHTLYNGKCYKLYLSGAAFNDAEAACNKLNEGHLAAYHSLEDYEFLQNLTRGNDNVWTGAREPDGHKNDPTLVRFTDGSTHDYIPADPGLNDGGSCLRLVSGVIGDKGCDNKWSFICMSDPIQPQESFVATCPRDFVPFKGRCYALFETERTYYEAEVTCNSQGGHLATFHSADVYEFLVMLTVGHTKVWIGLYITSSRDYEFTKDERPTVSDIGRDCQAIEYSDQFRGNGCSDIYPFICMIGKELGSPGDFDLLIDGDPDTCVKTGKLTSAGVIYMTRLNVTNPNNHGSITLNVMWNAEINCMQRQVLFTKQTASACNTLTACPLVTDNDIVTSACVYECPCDQNGCDVTYFDSQLDYEDQPGDACALHIRGE